MNDYIYEDIVYSSECDPQMNLSIVGTFQKIQNAFSLFMKSINLDGFTLITKYGATWIYHKNKAILKKSLKWNEKFYAKCFFSKCSSVKCVLDIAFYNFNNELCVYSQIELCVLDYKTKTIRRLSSIEFKDFEISSSLLNITFDNIEVLNASKVSDRKVCLSSLDLNNHTNNIEYIRFIIDTYSKENLYCSNTLYSIQIEYLNQSKLNDDLVIYKEELNKKDNFLIKVNENTITKCQFCFK